jgi:FAD/FMN-containing dehydrogenase
MSDSGLSSLRELFRGRLLSDAAEAAPFLRDYRGTWQGRALAVAQPDTAADVASVLRWCCERRVPALLLSLRRLNRIRQVDAVNSTLIAEAGCTLQQVQAAAREAGRLYPLSFAAEGSCAIGGTLATNAGGVQVLRYGNARELCLGLEVATPQGELWDGLRGLRKDNTGYSLRNLYIGADAVIPGSLAQFQALWALRENISEAQAAEGRSVKHDISLPASRIAEFIAATDAAIQGAFAGLRMVVFGHLGDGNLHYNVSPPADRAGPQDAAFAELEAQLNRLVHDAVVAHGGSISAEHGLGVLRRDEAARYKSPVELRLMRAVKAALDPQNLMNPGKLLAAETSL